MKSISPVQTPGITRRTHCRWAFFRTFQNVTAIGFYDQTSCTTNDVTVDEIGDRVPPSVAHDYNYKTHTQLVFGSRHNHNALVGVNDPQYNNVHLPHTNERDIIILT